MYVSTDMAIDAALDTGNEVLVDKAAKADPISKKVGRKKRHMGKPLPNGGRMQGTKSTR